MTPRIEERTTDGDGGAISRLERTDLTRWRLKVASGRQTWHYLSDEVDDTLVHRDWPQTDVERYALGLPVMDATTHEERPMTPLECADRGYSFFKLLQTEDGHWAGEYGGPLFMIPGLVIAYYVCGQKFEEAQRLELIRYLSHRASPVDGGWGLHIEGHSTVFGTALNYVSLRLLGLPVDHPICTKARFHLLSIGGAIGIPSWGKFWLSLLGVYEWDGMNPVTPELWALPYFIPFHPGRYWIHTRAVYMPMSFLYGKRYVHPLTNLTRSLRRELYPVPYEGIHWPSARNNISKWDLYSPHTTVLKACNIVLGLYERVAPKWLRGRALKEVFEQITMEDENTFYLDVGPVNKAMNMVAVWVERGEGSAEFQAHLPRVRDFLWMGPEGMMMNGTNGSQLWDTAFMGQALVESGLAQKKEHRASVQAILRFLDDTQIKRNVPNMERCYRHPSLGAWPFSTRDQGYTVSDCTAEGLKAVMYLQDLDFTEEAVPYERQCQAVDILLGMQNADGGFASYELIRTTQWIEKINPAELFANIMTEYSYPECTTASVMGLVTFSKKYPNYRKEEIELVKERAVEYILREQREDGSWFGSWAICFTYASMFATESLACVGQTYETSAASRKACEFLLSYQRADGGWGESYKSCETGRYVQHADPQVVQTAWACLALMTARCPDVKAIGRGIALIMSRQMANGEWLQEGIEGVFNKNCMISYPNYKFIFPIWALGRYSRLYGDDVVEV